MKNDTTHFGYETVEEREKARRVADVFDSVASRYDLMNDLMSGGMHRLWKAFTIQRSGVREGSRVLDVAGGTGDLALAFAKKAGKSGQVWLTDINNAMLARGRDRLLDKGYVVPAAQCDAEKLPFPDDWFDCVTVAFGLRNMTHKDVALAEMHRVIPRVGKMVTDDSDSYRYLSESIRVHPGQEELKQMMEQAGLEKVEYFNMALGVVALHRGFKF